MLRGETRDFLWLRLFDFQDQLGVLPQRLHALFDGGSRALISTIGKACAFARPRFPRRHDGHAR